MSVFFLVDGDEEQFKKGFAVLDMYCMAGPSAKAVRDVLSVCFQSRKLLHLIYGAGKSIVMRMIIHRSMVSSFLSSLSSVYGSEVLSLKLELIGIATCALSAA